MMKSNYETHIVCAALTTTAPSLSAANTFIINSIEHIGANDGASLLSTAATNNLRTRLEPIQSMPSAVSSAMTDGLYMPRETLATDLAAFQKQEMDLRLRELQLKVDTEEIRKELAREELQHMRQIHRMKVREMELRLKNIDRS